MAPTPPSSTKMPYSKMTLAQQRQLSTSQRKRAKKKEKEQTMGNRQVGDDNNNNNNNNETEDPLPETKDDDEPLEDHQTSKQDVNDDDDDDEDDNDNVGGPKDSDSEATEVEDSDLPGSGPSDDTAPRSSSSSRSRKRTTSKPDSLDDSFYGITEIQSNLAGSSISPGTYRSPFNGTPTSSPLKARQLEQTDELSPTKASPNHLTDDLIATDDGNSPTNSTRSRSSYKSNALLDTPVLSASRGTGPSQTYNAVRTLQTLESQYTKPLEHVLDLTHNHIRSLSIGTRFDLCLQFLLDLRSRIREEIFWARIATAVKNGKSFSVVDDPYRLDADEYRRLAKQRGSLGTNGSYSNSAYQDAINNVDTPVFAASLMAKTILNSMTQESKVRCKTDAQLHIQSYRHLINDGPWCFQWYVRTLVPSKHAFNQQAVKKVEQLKLVGSSTEDYRAFIDKCRDLAAILVEHDALTSKILTVFRAHDDIRIKALVNKWTPVFRSTPSKFNGKLPLMLNSLASILNTILEDHADDDGFFDDTASRGSTGSDNNERILAHPAVANIFNNEVIQDENWIQSMDRDHTLAMMGFCHNRFLELEGREPRVDEYAHNSAHYSNRYPTDNRFQHLKDGKTPSTPCPFNNSKTDPSDYLKTKYWNGKPFRFCQGCGIWTTGLHGHQHGTPKHKGHWTGHPDDAPEYLGKRLINLVSASFERKEQRQSSNKRVTVDSSTSNSKKSRGNNFRSNVAQTEAEANLAALTQSSAFAAVVAKQMLKLSNPKNKRGKKGQKKG